MSSAVFTLGGRALVLGHRHEIASVQTLGTLRIQVLFSARVQGRNLVAVHRHCAWIVV